MPSEDACTLAKKPKTFYTLKRRMVCLGKRGCTFACGGATVVFKVGAVFALVVLRASAVVVRGQVEARRSVETRVRGAIVDVQLRQMWGRKTR